MAARVGNADRKSYQRWQRSMERQRRKVLGGGEAATAANLERAVMALAASHPEYVVMGA